MSGESSLVVKGTLNPPVPVLAGHPVPTALLMNVSVGKRVGWGVLVDLKKNFFQIRRFIYIYIYIIFLLNLVQYIFSYPSSNIIIPFYVCVCVCVCVYDGVPCFVLLPAWCGANYVALCEPICKLVLCKS